MPNPPDGEPRQLPLGPSVGRNRAQRTPIAVVDEPRSGVDQPTRTKELQVPAPFLDSIEFADDVHGSVRVSPLERDVIDTPEFQRLFRLSQLGFVDLVYRSANHTRGCHSIGACFWAKKLIGFLNENNKRFGVLHRENKPQITVAERVLISLGALVHDLPHGPFSHDIEKKTHLIYLGKRRENPTRVKSHYGLYDKHDEFASNPALYVLLMDTERSLLARVLRHYSPEFAALLSQEGEGALHIRPFVKLLGSSNWPEQKDELLPQLLFHVLVYEKPREADNYSLKIRTSFAAENANDWGLGPRDSWQALHESWYQPFRHDIIGDTLSADLLDYLMRDQARLGMKNTLDPKLLEYYVLVPVGNGARSGNAVKNLYRCAIDLDDHKRGTFRAERLNDIFRLLDLRHQIHEKAVFHRVVQSAVAMLSRAGLILGPSKPSLESIYGFGSPTPALASDDHFLQLLLPSLMAGDHAGIHQSLPAKLSERRVYRPLMVIPGDRVSLLLRDLGSFESSLEHPLRELAAIVDSPFFSNFFLLISTYIERLLQHALDDENEIDEHIKELVKDQAHLGRVLQVVPKRVIFWTTPYKQLYKDPAILVRVRGITETLDGLQNHEQMSEALRLRVQAGLKDAETKNEGLWKLYVFLSDGLFYTGILAKALTNHPCASDSKQHKSHLEAAQRIVVRSLRAAWQYWRLTQKNINLERIAEFKELNQLLQLFVSEKTAFDLGGQDIPGLVSAVLVDQYLHGDDMSNCRDVRYKFEKQGDLDPLLMSIEDVERREMVRQAIRQIALDGLKSEELSELVTRLAKVSDLSGLVQTVAARNNPVAEKALKSLWRQDLD